MMNSEDGNPTFEDGMLRIDDGRAAEEVVVSDKHESRALGCGEMVFDTMKAVKFFFDPVSDCVGGCLGFVCCVAVVAANAEDDKNRRATRYDVVHAKAIRRQERDEANCGFRLGFFVGDALIDTASSVVGAVVGVPRAVGLLCTGNRDINNEVLGYSREEIDAVDIMSSCRCG
jgi:hypothetical protein